MLVGVVAIISITKSVLFKTLTNNSEVSSADFVPRNVDLTFGSMTPPTLCTSADTFEYPRPLLHRS